MSLEATHAFFALRVAEIVGAKDLDALVAGTVYPDSRRVTNVHRTLTHQGDVPSLPFNNSISDFKKGWALHLAYDDFSFHQFKFFLPESLKEAHVAFGTNSWLHRAAFKIIEDLNCIELLGDELNILQRVSSTEKPFDEDSDRLELYYTTLRELYSKKPLPQNYIWMWKQWDMGNNAMDDVVNLAEEYLKDKTLVNNIYGVLNKAVDDLKKRI